MKKSLIALAVASVFIAPVALAQTVIYGKANVSFDMHDNGAATNNKVNKVSSNGSRIGFKGSEDLGNGLSAFWGIETSLAFDDPNKSGTPPGTYTASTSAVVGDNGISAGLGSKTMGSLIIGHGASPLKSSTRGLDLFDGTQAQNSTLMLNAKFFNYAGGNGLTYVSPNMSGVTVLVGKGFSESATSNQGNALHSLATYNAGPLYAFVVQATVNTGAGAIEEVSTTSFGGSYTMGAFQLNAIYESNDNSDANSVLTAWTSTYVGGIYNISKTDAVKLAITNQGDRKVANVTEITGDKQTVVGYDHKLSKDTKVYALFSRATPNVAPKVTTSIFSVGMNKNF